MRRDHAGGQVEQRVVGRQRLGIRDVEDRGQPPGAHLGHQGIVVDQHAPGGVDQRGAVHHAGQLRGADHPLRGRQRRGVQADHVAGLQQLVQLDLVDPEGGGAVGAQVGVGDRHRAPVGPQQLDHRPAHVGGTHQPDPLGPVAHRVTPGQRRQRRAPQPLALDEGRLVRPQDGRHRVLGHRHRVGGGPGRDAQSPRERRGRHRVAQGAPGVGEHRQLRRPLQEVLVHHDAAPVAEQHVGRGQHLVRPVGGQRLDGGGLEHVGDLGERGEMLGAQGVRLEPRVHRQGDGRAGHVGTRAVISTLRLAATSTSRSGRAL
jgi:hypothetical protein